MRNVVSCRLKRTEIVEQNAFFVGLLRRMRLRDACYCNYTLPIDLQAV